MFDKLKGYRTIILSWLLTALVVIEQFFNIVSGLISTGGPLITSGGWKVAVFMAVVITLKQIITDAQGRYAKK